MPQVDRRRLIMPWICKWIISPSKQCSSKKVKVLRTNDFHQEGTVAKLVSDTEVSITALFLKEAISAALEEHEDSSQVDWNNAVVIVQTFYIWLHTTPGKDSGEYILTVEKFKIWDTQPGYRQKLSLPFCMEIDSVRLKMRQELQERKTRYATTVHDTNSVGLTQLLDEMMCTSQNQELSNEIDRNCTEVSPAQQNDISRTDIGVLVEKLLRPFTIEEFLIPESQFKKLGQIKEWQPDYQPLLETKITSSSDPVERPHDFLAGNTLATDYHGNICTWLDNDTNRNGNICSKVNDCLENSKCGIENLLTGDSYVSPSPEENISQRCNVSKMCEASSWSKLFPIQGKIGETHSSKEEDSNSAGKDFLSGESNNIEREISSQSSVSPWQHELQSLRMSCDESFSNCSSISQISPNNKPLSKESKKSYNYIQSMENASHDIHCMEQNVDCSKLKDSEYLKQDHVQVDPELTPARITDVSIVSVLQRDSLSGHACERLNMTDCLLRDHSLLDYMLQLPRETKLNSTEFPKYVVDVEKANGALELNCMNAEDEAVETTHSHNDYTKLRNDCAGTRNVVDGIGTNPSLSSTSVVRSDELHSDLDKIGFNKIASVTDVDCDFGDPGDICVNRHMNMKQDSTNIEKKSVDETNIEVCCTCTTSPTIVTVCDEKRKHVVTSEVKQLQVNPCAPMYFDADLGSNRRSRRLHVKVLQARKKDLQHRSCINSNTNSDNSAGTMEIGDHVCTNNHSCGHEPTKTVSSPNMVTSELNIQSCIKKLSQPMYQNLAPHTCKNLKSTNEVDVDMRIVSQNETTCGIMEGILDKREFVSDNRDAGNVPTLNTPGYILLNSQVTTECNEFHQPSISNEHVLNPCSGGNISENTRQFIALSDNCTQPFHVNMSCNTLEFVPQLSSTCLLSSDSENSFLGCSPIQNLDKSIGIKQGDDNEITNGFLVERIGNKELNCDNNIPAVTSTLACTFCINKGNDKIEEEINKKHFNALCFSENFTGVCEMPKSKAMLESEIKESSKNVDIENQLNTSVEKRFSNGKLSISKNNSKQLFSKTSNIKSINAGHKKRKLPDITDIECISRKRTGVSAPLVQHNTVSIMDKTDSSSGVCIASCINNIGDRTKGDTEVSCEQLTIVSADIHKQPNSTSSQMKVDCSDIRENTCTTTDESKLDVSDNVQLLTSCESSKVHIDGYSLKCKACALNDKNSLPNSARSTTRPSISNMPQLSLKRVKASNNCKNSTKQPSQLITEKNERLSHCERKSESGSLLYSPIKEIYKFYNTKNMKQTELDGYMINISDLKSHVIGSCPGCAHSDVSRKDKNHHMKIKENTEMISHLGRNKTSEHHLKEKCSIDEISYVKNWLDRETSSNDESNDVDVMIKRSARKHGMEKSSCIKNSLARQTYDDTEKPSDQEVGLNNSLSTGKEKPQNCVVKDKPMKTSMKMKGLYQSSANKDTDVTNAIANYWKIFDADSNHNSKKIAAGSQSSK